MPHGTNILNPMAGATDKGRVQANLSDEVFNYFFKKVFVGERGPRQVFICVFFQRFYEACQQEGINPNGWDESGESEAAVARVLERLNFRDVDRELYDAKSIAFSDGAASVSAQPEPKRSARPRRTPRAPSLVETQPSSEGHVSGATGGTGEASSNDQPERTDDGQPPQDGKRQDQ